MLLYTEYIHPHCNQKVKQSMADNQGQGGTVFYLAPDQTKKYTHQGGNADLYHRTAEDMKQPESQGRYQNRHTGRTAENMNFPVQEAAENKLFRKCHRPHTIDDFIKILP